MMRIHSSLAAAATAAVAGSVLLAGCSANSAGSSSASPSAGSGEAIARPTSCEMADPIRPNTTVSTYFTSSFFNNGGAENYTVSELPVGTFNTVNYAFGTPGTDNVVLQPADEQNLVELTQLREANCYVKVNLSIGGWGNRLLWTPMLTSQTNRSAFVTSVMSTLDQYHLDGVDIDWENWDLASDAEIAGVASLYSELRSAIDSSGTDYLLSSAVAATPFEQFRMPTLEQLKPLDVLNVMGYDLHATFGPTTAFATNLRFDPADPDYVNPQAPAYKTKQPTSVASAIEYYKSGLPASKILMGIPIYAHAQWVKDVGNHGLYQQVYDPNVSSEIAYQEDTYGPFGTCANPKKPGTIFYNKKADSYWIYDKSPQGSFLDVFISYEDPLSLKSKMDYVDSEKLGGVMTWAPNDDAPLDSPGSLMNGIFQAMKDPATGAGTVPTPAKLTPLGGNLYQCG